MTLSKLIDAWVSVIQEGASWKAQVLRVSVFSLFPNSKRCKVSKDRAVPEDYWKQDKFLKIH